MFQLFEGFGLVIRARVMCRLDACYTDLNLTADKSEGTTHIAIFKIAT